MIWRGKRRQPPGGRKKAGSSHGPCRRLLAISQTDRQLNASSHLMSLLTATVAEHDGHESNIMMQRLRRWRHPWPKQVEKNDFLRSPLDGHLFPAISLCFCRKLDELWSRSTIPSHFEECFSDSLLSNSIFSVRNSCSIGHTVQVL